VSLPDRPSEELCGHLLAVADSKNGDSEAVDRRVTQGGAFFENTGWTSGEDDAGRFSRGEGPGAVVSNRMISEYTCSP